MADFVGVGHLVERLERGDAREGGAHAVLVVLDDKDDGEAPDGGQVEGLVDGALVDGAVAEEDHRDVARGLVLLREGDAGRGGDLLADEAPAAPEALGDVEDVHGAAEPLDAAGGLAEEFVHDGLGRHAAGHGLSVDAVGAHHDIGGAERGGGADGDGLLPDVQVAEAHDFSEPVGASCGLFETALLDHVAVHFEQGFFGEFGCAATGEVVGVGPELAGLLHGFLTLRGDSAARSAAERSKLNGALALRGLNATLRRLLRVTRCALPYSATGAAASTRW